MTTETMPETEKELKKNLRERLILPFAIPLGAAVVVALLGISFSRVFLAGAGDHSGAESVAEEVSKSPAPVLWATIITLFVLFGAAGISMMKSMKTTTFVLAVSGFLVAAVLAGSILAGASDVKEETVEIGNPTEAELAAAQPVPRLEIDALPTNVFQSKVFETQAGITEIDYIGKGGGHRLKFKDSRFNWFDLVVNGTSTDAAPINLEAGTYYIFCPIPGHEAAGMFADLVVK
jgi:plastocyanin